MEIMDDVIAQLAAAQIGIILDNHVSGLLYSAIIISIFRHQLLWNQFACLFLFEKLLPENVLNQYNMV